MLTRTEESGLRDILNDIPDTDLLSLADTVTKKLLKVTDRNAAIQAILTCLEKPSDLLDRKKVTKKMLFSYLLKVKSFVSPQSTKSDFVRMCLREWHSVDEPKGNDLENNANVSPTPSTATAAQQESYDWLSVMGIQFAVWFFPMYNELRDFGPEHFWVDCRLMGELKTAQDRKEAAVVGATEVVMFLRSLIVNDRFYFDANTSRDSVTSEQDPHGLVRILVSGVVHQTSNCVGLFDSFFGLVRNPAYNDNWKIKWIHLKIHVNSNPPAYLPPVSQLPSICERMC